MPNPVAGNKWLTHMPNSYGGTTRLKSPERNAEKNGVSSQRTAFLNGEGGNQAGRTTADVHCSQAQKHLNCDVRSNVTRRIRHGHGRSMAVMWDQREKKVFIDPITLPCPPTSFPLILLANNRVSAITPAKMPGNLGEYS